MERYNKNLEKQFKSEFNQISAISATAPGRVNLIGEHTDYNEGFVFPVALDFHVEVIAAPSGDNNVTLYSADFNQKDTFNIENFGRNNNILWSNYVRGVIDEFRKLGFNPGGFNALFSGNVPMGSGLSSSAALEVAMAVMISGLFNFNIGKKDLALLCQRAENKFVGVNCGIMDQYISLFGKKDHALFIDCRDLSCETVPLFLKDYSLVICNSKASRDLAGSAYNKRRAECEEGVKLLSEFYPSVKSLRHVTPEEFKFVEDKLPPVIRKRCRHVITENDRVLKSIKALKEGNLTVFGKLMTESHISLRYDYEVSSDCLDCLVEFALKGRECIGSRLTGAGFGGCTVSLVEKKGLPEFKSRVIDGYGKKAGKIPEIYVSNACDGAWSAMKNG